MESKLDIRKEGDNIIVFDQSVYRSEEDFMVLYNTFNASIQMLEERITQGEDSIIKMKEERDVMTARFNSIIDFMAEHDIEVPKEEEK